ncbi:MAG: HlyD family efflux transporter periplasmic adaptor subunit [Oscillibacter sp.]|nr:HlyD family efflux transporter periplasmic adaptor subunit [Oscillibacter sp.]
MSQIMEQQPQATTHEIPSPPAADINKSPNTVLKKKKRRRFVRRIIILLLVAAAAFFAWKHFRGGEQSGGEGEVVIDTVHYDAITSVVESSGLTKAKNSETITLTTAGTVMDVFVTEGQMVTAGDPLFVIDSPAAQTAVEKARSNVEGIQKQLSTAEKDLAGLNLSPGYPGKLMDTVKLNPGDTISKGQKVATLADDTRLRLTQYYSYAYEGDLYAGQSMQVSIPALMTTVTGTVENVYMVSRITPEGSKLFSAEIVIENEGVLTAGMVASATTAAGGETVYPYEPGRLEYYRVGDLCSTVSGTVLSSSLVDYLQVSPGQVLVQIDGEASESELFTIQQNLETALEELRVAEQNLANCSAMAPINGKVIGLMATLGSEIPANTALVTISDTTAITITANVDERNISYIKPGMMVELDQWGTPGMGIVESVSLSSTINNGVATYPIVISADNFDESIQVNSYINYRLTASQNDNCLVLPIQSVRTVGLEDGSSATVVYVKSDQRPENAIEVPFMDEEIPEGFYPVPVEIGIQDNYNVEIKSGVEEGTEVFTQILSNYMGSWG